MPSMLTLRSILAMSLPLRLTTIATIASLLFAQPSVQQTSTTCNPTKESCPADPALGKSITVDFTSGASSQFTSSGDPTYGSNGVEFTIAQSGDAPMLVSNWYIMFGTYTIRMKAAPGQGIVSSAVLQSDDLDEIDWEWVGNQDNQAQTNYFGKGQTTTYDRGAAYAVTNPTGDWHTYSVIWTDEQIVWQIDGSTVRVLSINDANGQYPQTPMRLKIGIWSGGDPSNAAGTIAWAGGVTNYADGPYTMYVESVAITDYSTGTAYVYGNESGDWQSIESEGGRVNGNAPADQTAASAPAITSSTSGGPEVGSGTCIWAARCSDGVSTIPVDVSSGATPFSPNRIVAVAGIGLCLLSIGVWI
ncbi:glycoside hydrolase family 16 protein [Acidomyces richmondensis BFW]|nr:MAG: glycoside hydrolase family 16 protein [Acidomyces sp. 'richmondensis']KYG45187.1 glycoside hydrolase family 16 protein [Acidomyces richmondensis BFW]